jgi:hypothetical protein
MAPPLLFKGSLANVARLAPPRAVKALLKGFVGRYRAAALGDDTCKVRAAAALAQV